MINNKKESKTFINLGVVLNNKDFRKFRKFDFRLIQLPIEFLLIKK